MNPLDPNLVVLQLVAQALGDSLRDELMLVGGCSVGLFITDESRPAVRATTDVDLVTQVASLGDYYNGLSPKLRDRGFTESANEGHMLRWTNGRLIIDVLPTDEKVFGHSVNRWYPEAFRHAQRTTLPNGLEILVVSAPHFIATKLEAFQGRGGGDYLHHDMEDIITVVDGRPELGREIDESPTAFKDYIRDEFDDLLADEGFIDQLPMHFRPDAWDQARVAIVIERLRHLAGI